MKVNLVSQCSHSIEVLNKFRSERGGLHYMQILGLLDMYFDIVAVEIENCLLFFHIAINF